MSHVPTNPLEPTPCSKTGAVPAFLDEQKALACIHCGLCLGSCPTYLETGNENDSPRGRIYLMRALQAGTLELHAPVARHLDLCLGCRACEAVCPSGVQYGALLEHTREHVEHSFKRGGFQTFLRRVVIEQVFPFPWRMKLALLPLRVLRALRLDGFLPPAIREAASLVPRDAKALDVPAFTPASKPGPDNAGPGRSVGFVRGCVMPVLFGSTNATTVQLLNHAGCDVHAPESQGCCGALFAHSGQMERARECARQNIAAFEALDISYIVINAAGCGSTLKEYGSLLAVDPAWSARAERFAKKVRDLSEVLTPSTPSSAESGAGGTVTYHDACHLAHAQRITREPRALVRGVAGTRFIEMPESDLCCGSAGTYNLTEPEMAARLQERKIQNILNSGATTVVTSNPGCLIQIQAGLAKAGATHVRAVHLADYLAEAQSPVVKTSCG